MTRRTRRILLVLVVALSLGSAVSVALKRAGSAAEAPRAASVNRLGPTRTATFTERWRAAFPVEVVGLPAVDGAGIVVTAGESEVVALAATGEVRWTAAVAGALVNAPRLDNDMVFVAAKRAVVALRRDTGAIVWSVPTAAEGDADDRANRPAVAVGSVVVATTASGRAFAVDRASGAPRWTVNLPTASTAEPGVGEGVVVVVGIAEWWALDPASGAIRWSADLGRFGTSSPVVYPDGDRLLALVASDARVSAVDALTGDSVWVAAADQSELFQVPVASGDEVLVPDHWGRLAAFDAHDGTPRWRVKGPDGIAEFGEPAVLAPQLVALPLDADGPRIGGPRGSQSIKVPGSGHGVAVTPEGQMIVTTWDGPVNYVVAYDVRAPSR